MKFTQLARASVAAIAFMGLAANSANSMSVSPTQVELKSAGSKSRAQVVVRNNSNAPLPVEAVLRTFKVDKDGKAHTGAVSNDFLVFPPQTLIRPGASQVFRITWVGEPLLSASRSYQLTLSQIPVKLQRSQNRVQVVLAFGVVINVAPPRGQAKLQLVSAGIVRNRNGQRNPVITVRNPSSVHALLPKARIRLAGSKWSKTLDSNFLNQKVGIGLVQPGQIRRFILPVALPRNVTKIGASISLNPH